MFKLLLFVVAALCGVCYCAPMEERSTLQCEPYGKPHGLVGVHGVHHKKRRHFGLKRGSGSRDTTEIVQTESDKDKFQFYQCKAPTDKYGKSNRLYEFGQVRSVEKPGYCLTSDNTWVYVSGDKKQRNRLEPYPGTKNGSLTLQPCAKKHGLTLRLQWYDLGKSDEQCYGNLELAGAGDDDPANAIVEEEGRVIMKPGNLVNYKDFYYLYLADGNGTSKC